MNLEFRPHPSLRRTASLTTTMAHQSGEMLRDAAQTIAHRSLVMARAGLNPTVDDQMELYRMGAEKVEAVVDSGFALFHGGDALQQQWLKLWSAQVGLSTAMWSWWGLWQGARHPMETFHAQQRLMMAWGETQEAALGLLPLSAETARQGMNPFHRRVTANARRLGRAGGRSDDS